MRRSCPLTPVQKSPFAPKSQATIQSPRPHETLPLGSSHQQGWQSLLTDDSYMRLIFEEAQTHSRKFSKTAEIERLQAKISSLQQQIEATTERVSELPKGINAQVFFDQILKLQKTKEDYELKQASAKAENVNQDSPVNLAEFQKFTEDLKRLASQTTDPNVQASICRKLNSKVDVSTTGITIHYHVGDHD